MSYFIEEAYGAVPSWTEEQYANRERIAMRKVKIQQRVNR